MSVHTTIKKVTSKTLQDMKSRGEKISMLTAYDYSMARIFDDAGIDAILVGDSAANVMAGFETTLPITLDHMIYHTQSVARAVKRSMVIADLPFGTYQGDSKQALASAVRMMKESGAHALKLEGGAEITDAVKRLINTGIPVMGHLGLTPQSIYKFGSYEVRAKEAQEAATLLENALLLEEAGCFAITLEKIPAALGKEVASKLHIPVIGIGAGRYVDGQVLVMHDMLGISKDFAPRFLRRYLHLYEEIKNATANYITDIKKQDFPGDREQY
ncbi:3-methyl-2-oxobutanoate hydroxymethyltransferase [Filimonas zeae]|uniref:3-methyl-2-oxobutanoate hydroxymethyltransferase n=1 Tax=Filimonas zeae TaxID=1737353 RepID=A0A917MTM3_9BACT|nr:3-methyl-2-oxobutanoate hydroxymethyltransferase [Filimonas zeae]MDR6337718.1 3-methyl-2-oxobutanoate hydroxymethyltransferase [Filimonas zeae]GGH59930.1 3-methyl-2-oxobutanoate hydroxymethyltransferase [Filimonas zeae]